MVCQPTKRNVRRSTLGCRVPDSAKHQNCCCIYPRNILSQNLSRADWQH
jgi:hypothetical protein